MMVKKEEEMKETEKKKYREEQRKRQSKTKTTQYFDYMPLPETAKEGKQQINLTM